MNERGRSSNTNSVAMATAVAIPTSVPTRIPRNRVCDSDPLRSLAMAYANRKLQSSAIRYGQKFGWALAACNSSGDIRKPAVQTPAKAVNHTAPRSQCTIAATRTAPQFSRIASPSFSCARRYLFPASCAIAITVERTYSVLLRAVSLLAQLAQAEGVVALGQPRTRFIAHQVAVVVGGDRQRERAE